jgi:hypothetical protein
MSVCPTDSARPRAVLIEPSLRRRSPENENICGSGRGLSANRVGYRESAVRRLSAELQRPAMASLFVTITVAFSHHGTARLGREDSNLEMANWNRMLSPVREEPQNLFSLKLIGPSKRWNFENRTESAESRASEINGPFGE